MNERKKNGDSGWKIDEALSVLQATIDPYIWEQGQDLYRRSAVTDFAIAPDGNVRIIVLDPRDARKFFVTVDRGRDGRVVAKCACPYRLNGRCRHQVVALEYLRAVSSSTAESSSEESETPTGSTASEDSESVSTPILYRLFANHDSPVPTCPDGSLLRLVLFALGGHNTGHSVGLQLYTGKGWSELRTSDLRRWVDRGSLGPHPRDALLCSMLGEDGQVRSQLDSETFTSLLSAFAETEAFVDRSGNILSVSRVPWSLSVELVRGDPEGIATRLECVGPNGESVDFQEVALVDAVGPWIQLDSGVFHPLIAGASGPLLAELQEADLSVASGDDLDRFLIDGVPQLQRLARERFTSAPGLIQEVEGVGGARLSLAGEPSQLEGQLELRYGEEWVVAPESPAAWTVTRDGQIQRYPAAGQSLARCRSELEGMGLEYEDGRWRGSGTDALERVLAHLGGFVNVLLPEELQAYDLVQHSPQLRLAVAVGSEPVTGASGAGSPGTFTVQFELTAAGRSLSVDSSALLESFEQRGRSGGVLRLADDTILGLDHPAVRELAELLLIARAESQEEDSQQLTLPATTVGRFLETDADIDVQFDSGVTSFATQLRGGSPTAEQILTPAIDERLRSYQRDAVAWFGELGRWGLAGILADEMGLGKTVMTLAHFFGRETRSQNDSVLVVCPTSLVFNWLDECGRFFPDIEATSLQGRPQKQREELIASDSDILLTSYALLRRDREALESREFRGVVLDEAQYIKNPRSQTAQAAFALRTPERWALTGTPVENHLGELWSVFRFLLPGFLGTAEEFRRAYQDPVDRGDTDVVDDLRHRIRPFILRRTKQQVLSDLPPCIEQVERVPLTDTQRELYEAELLMARAAVDQSDESTARFRVLAALMRLRQICCHPQLVASEDVLAERTADDGDRVGSKFELLFERLEECIEEGHRVLLFSQFTSMLDLIEGELDQRSIVRCRLDGSTRDREAQVRSFERDTDIPIFLISLKAGGYGLNLTGADTVILYDPWWNPATEEQAVARAHRIGQALPVHVHRLLTIDTVEERIHELQAAKRGLAGKLLDGDEESLAGLDLNELRELLS